MTLLSPRQDYDLHLPHRSFERVERCREQPVALELLLGGEHPGGGAAQRHLAVLPGIPRWVPAFGRVRDCTVAKLSSHPPSREAAGYARRDGESGRSDMKVSAGIASPRLFAPAALIRFRASVI